MYPGVLFAGDLAALRHENGNMKSPLVGEATEIVFDDSFRVRWICIGDETGELLPLPEELVSAGLVASDAAGVGEVGEVA